MAKKREKLIRTRTPNWFLEMAGLIETSTSIAFHKDGKWDRHRLLSPARNILADIIRRAVSICWESRIYNDVLSVCMLPDKHRGPHVWTPVSTEKRVAAIISKTDQS